MPLRADQLFQHVTDSDFRHLKEATSVGPFRCYVLPAQTADKKTQRDHLLNGFSNYVNESNTMILHSCVSNSTEFIETLTDLEIPFAC